MAPAAKPWGPFVSRKQLFGLVARSCVRGFQEMTLPKTTMQRVCPVTGGVKTYLGDPDCLVTEETRKCPFCKKEHPLRLHGWYSRFLLPPETGEVHSVPVRRLLCQRTGHTLSLLPDFCLPYRQHGPGILALFLEGLLKGLRLLSALRKARPDATRHPVAQSLLAGFLRRRGRILTYLASLHSRVLEPSREVPKSLRTLARLFLGLTHRFSSPVRAFEHHGRFFHKRFELALA